MGKMARVALRFSYCGTTITLTRAGSDGRVYIRFDLTTCWRWLLWITGQSVDNAFLGNSARATPTSTSVKSMRWGSR